MLSYVHRQLKGCSRLFSLLKHLAEAYDELDFKRFTNTFDMLAPFMQEIGAIRCLYICAMAKEIATEDVDLSSSQGPSVNKHL